MKTKYWVRPQEVSEVLDIYECPYCGFHVKFDSSYIELYEPDDEIKLLCPNPECYSNLNNLTITIPAE